MEKELRQPTQFSKIPMGSTVCLVTSVLYKYEGDVIAYNLTDMTVTLKNVKFMGKDCHDTENTADNDEKPKFPAVGTHFDSVTFWLTNVKKMWIINEAQVNTKIGDIAVKETNGGEKIHSPVKPVTINHDGEKSTIPVNESNRDRKSNRRPPPRHNRNVDVHRRTFTGYNTASVPVSRGRFSVPVRESPLEGRFTRRSGQRGSRSREPYTQRTRNGGLLLYLPPDLTSLYRSNGLNIVPQSNFRGRPRNSGRKQNHELPTGSTRAVSNPRAGSEVDCSKPYDFETANEELRIELAKIDLNYVSTEGRNAQSSGDRQPGNLSNDGGLNCNGKTNDSGASGDSSAGIANADAESQINPDNMQSLSRGEFYVREKCFFDQISRSEGGPRGPVVSNGKSERGRINQDRHRRLGGFSRSGNTGAMCHARLERQLNIETFGQSATRNIYNQRRRLTGYVSRDMLVSATA